MKTMQKPAMRLSRMRAEAKVTKSGNPAGGGGDKLADLWEAVKWVAKFLGVVGGTGGGFAVLAFGIGYLATKSHDAMLGLPTTVTAYTAYVRTGALFFPRSIHDMVLVTTSPEAARVALTAVVVAALVVLILGLWKAARTFLSKESNQLGPFVVVSGSVVLLAALYLPYHVEPLHQSNTNLLFQTEAVGDSVSLNTALRREDAGRLHQRYGAEGVAVLAFTYVAYALFRWRRSLNAGEPSVWLYVTDWLARPALYAALAAFVITIPSLYGVLAVSPAPCVQPFVAATPNDRVGTMKGHGLLWSDLSSDTNQVVILEKTPYGYAQQFYPRNLVPRLETKRCRLLEPPIAKEHE